VADLSDIANLEPADFAKAVKNTPDAKIREIMTSDQRTQILDAIFDRLPLAFRPEKAGNTDTVIHWNVTGRPDGGTDQYEVVVKDQTCTTSNKFEHDPKLAITIGPVELLKLLAGQGNPVTMFMTGKIKAKGDLGLAGNFSKLFSVPKA